MGEHDAQTERLDRLEQQISTLNDSLERAMRSGSQRDADTVERQQTRIEDEFTPEERRMVREHREWSAFERNMQRWEQSRDEARQLEKAQRRAARRAAEGEGDDEGKPAPKPKAKAKRKPPGRHDDGAGGDGEQQETEKKPHWLLRD